MKILYLTILCSLAISCKSRKVATNKAETTTTTSSILTVKKDSTSIDTGRIHTEIKTAKNVQDSDEVVITPDSGKVQTIHILPGKDFIYTGSAKSIIYKKKSVDRSVINQSEQNNKSLTVRKTEADTLAQHQIVNQVIKNKTVDAKADHGWIWAMIGIIALICIAGYVATKYLKI